MASKKPELQFIPGATEAENAIFSKKKFYLHLKHLPSGDEIKFKAMLTQFEDQYTSDWNTEQVFGRMDPIKSYRGTQRIITLGWDVVAASLEEAEFNLRNCSTLLSMLYPSYAAGAVKQEERQTSEGTIDRESAEDAVTSSNTEKVASPTGNAATIQGAPLFKLKFANLIQSAKAPALANSSIEDGLIGAVDGLTYSPDVEQGFFDPAPGILYPQTIRLSFGFHVTHDHPLGWSGKDFRADGVFPYPKSTGGE
jgi:hypothetical protein